MNILTETTHQLSVLILLQKLQLLLLQYQQSSAVQHSPAAKCTKLKDPKPMAELYLAAGPQGQLLWCLQCLKFCIPYGQALWGKEEIDETK